MSSFSNTLLHKDIPAGWVLRSVRIQSLSSQGSPLTSESHRARIGGCAPEANRENRFGSQPLHYPQSIIPSLHIQSKLACKGMRRSLGNRPSTSPTVSSPD